MTSYDTFSPSTVFDMTAPEAQFEFVCCLQGRRFDTCRPKHGNMATWIDATTSLPWCC